MVPKNPLGKIKDLTRGAASVGLHVAGQATSLTAGAVSKLVQGKKLTVDPPVKAEAPEARTPEAMPPETEKPAEPVTSIDAAADVEHVDVTPADVARKMARKAPARPAAKKKAPAKKTAPGAKLPPRRKVEQSQPDVTA